MKTKCVLIVIIVLGLSGIQHVMAQAEPDATKKTSGGGIGVPATKPLIVRRKPRPLIYNAPDLIPKTDSLDARNRNGTFKVTTLIDGTEILLRRLYRLGSGSYLVVDKNGQTLPSSIRRTENGCFLCWDNCQKAVRIKCPPG